MMFSKTQSKTIRIYVAARASHGNKLRNQGAAYAIVTERDGRVFEHWGAGNEVETVAMAAHAMIRVFDEYLSFNSDAKIEVITTAARSLLARTMWGDTDAAREKTGNKVRCKDRQELWADFATKAADVKPSYGAQEIEKKGPLWRRAERLAKDRATAAAKEAYSEGVHRTDAMPMSWLGVDA